MKREIDDTKQDMKRLLTICVLLTTMIVTAFAQKMIDYTTYDVIAKAGNVTVLVKDNDYRMLVGSLRKPKTTFLLGSSKEQTTQKFDRLLEIVTNENYSRSDRQINFCGIGFHLTVKGSGDNERFTFSKDGEKVKFELSKFEIETFRKSLV